MPWTPVGEVHLLLMTIQGWILNCALDICEREPVPSARLHTNDMPVLKCHIWVDKIQENGIVISVHTMVLRDTLIIKCVVVRLNPFQIQAVESLFIDKTPIFAQVYNLQKLAALLPSCFLHHLHHRTTAEVTKIKN